MQRAAGEVVELEYLLTHHHRMTGVRAARKAHHQVRLASERVHDFSLAFIAPLGTDNRNSGHCSLLNS